MKKTETTITNEEWLALFEEGPESRRHALYLARCLADEDEAALDERARARRARHPDESVVEAARALGVSRQRIYRAERKGIQ